MKVTKPRILVIGCLGQIGTALVPALRLQYGAANVVSADIRGPARDDVVFSEDKFYHVDVTQEQTISRLVTEKRIDWVIHLASVLSAAGELNPTLAQQVNIGGLHNVLKVSCDRGLRVMVPSSIAAFGGNNYNRNPTGNHEVQQPTTMYGVSKVYTEALGAYYHQSKGLDFRSLRYPGIISHEAEPGGGTTDYAVEIFYEALRNNKYEVYLKEDTMMPMMYMEDCVRATMEMMAADDSKWDTRTFNVGAFSFTPEMLTAEIQKHLPNFTATYKPDHNLRQKIADSWPQTFDDCEAGKQWNWKAEWEFEEFVQDMLERLDIKLRAENAVEAMTHAKSHHHKT